MPEEPLSRKDAALRHVAEGWAVFSVWSTDDSGTCKCRDGAVCGSPGKHPIPKDGFHAASTDPAIVETMMSAGSEPNYGLVWPDGLRERVIVMDVDGADWRERMADLVAQYGTLPPTRTARTPSSGLHLFYRWPDGVPLPEGNHLHGFLTRFPGKGYVVGTGSRINGSTYTYVGPTMEIATLPLSWVVTGPTPAASEPLITISAEKPGYELPKSIPTGSRHDEVTRFVASRWNKGITKAEIEVSVRTLLVPLMDDAPTEAKLRHDIDEAWDTAVRKWKEPAGGGGGTEGTTTEGVSGGESAGSGRMVVEVGLLDAPEAPIPPQMRPEAFTTSSQVALLLDHFTPRTDAAFEGLLVTTMTYLGALMGHTPACFYGSREQHTAFFSMLVGTTGASRKGTSLSLVRDALSQATDGVRGMKYSVNSGEGLVALAQKADGGPLLIEEEEFERFLTSKRREGSTLSSILRQAFDDVPLSSVTVTRILKADRHHVGFLGNVTIEGLTTQADAVDVKNGFYNRILWTGVFRRDSVVTIHDNAISTNLRDSIRDAIKWANALPTPLIGGTTHQFSPEARQLLLDATTRYSEGVGLAPFLSRRLDTIAARIALTFACLDTSRVIEADHVRGALAITDYAKDSAAWVFPETTGDVDADLLLRHLRASPDHYLGSREIGAIVGNQTKYKQRAADLLMLMGYARKATRPRKGDTAGRGSEGLELT